MFLSISPIVRWHRFRALLFTCEFMICAYQIVTLVIDVEDGSLIKAIFHINYQRNVIA